MQRLRLVAQDTKARSYDVRILDIDRCACVPQRAGMMSASETVGSVEMLEGSLVETSNSLGGITGHAYGSEGNIAGRSGQTGIQSGHLLRTLKRKI